MKCPKCGNSNLEFGFMSGRCWYCRKCNMAQSEWQQSRIDELEASIIKHFQEEHLAGDGPEIYRWKLRVKKLEAENKRLREALQIFADHSNWREHRYQDSEDRWILDYIWNAKCEPMEVVAEIPNNKQRQH